MSELDRQRLERHADDRAESDGEVLCELADIPPLLDCSQVSAVCTGVRRVVYAPYRRERLVLEFRVFEPQKYAGTPLRMYVTTKRAWKNPPLASALHKLTLVATGRARKILTRSDLVGKAFVCRVHNTDAGGASYSVVDRVLERLTG